MKAILEFNLPEDKEDFDLARNAQKYCSHLSEIRNLMRSYTKSGIPIEQLRRHSSQVAEYVESKDKYLSAFKDREELTASELILVDYICEQISELIPWDEFI